MGDSSSAPESARRTPQPSVDSPAAAPAAPVAPLIPSQAASPSPARAPSASSSWRIVTVTLLVALALIGLAFLTKVL